VFQNRKIIKRLNKLGDLIQKRKFEKIKEFKQKIIDYAKEHRE